MATDTKPQEDRKEDSAYRTIGEVAEELEIEQHVLRFWEKRFSKLEPVKRKGRRYYKRDDIVLIKEIKVLLHDQGYTIRGVEKLLNEGAHAMAKAIEQPDLFGEDKPIHATETVPFIAVEDLESLKAI